MKVHVDLAVEACGKAKWVADQFDPKDQMVSGEGGSPFEALSRMLSKFSEINGDLHSGGVADHIAFNGNITEPRFMADYYARMAREQADRYAGELEGEAAAIRASMPHLIDERKEKVATDLAEQHRLRESGRMFRDEPNLRVPDIFAAPVNDDAPQTDGSYRGTRSFRDTPPPHVGMLRLVRTDLAKAGVSANVQQEHKGYDDHARIYVVVASKVDGETGLIQQPIGRMAAQAAHVVSKMRVEDRLDGVAYRMLCGSVDNKMEDVSRHVDVELARSVLPITTIVLEARDSRELLHIENLLATANIRSARFVDENPEYRNGTALTAICTYPVLPEKLQGITDYLPLWTPENAPASHGRTLGSVV